MVEFGVLTGRGWGGGMLVCDCQSISSRTRHKLGADLIIHGLYRTLPLLFFSPCSSAPSVCYRKSHISSECHRRHHHHRCHHQPSPLHLDWQVWWCLPLLSPTFNSREDTRQGCANGLLPSRACSAGNCGPYAPQKRPTDWTLRIHDRRQKLFQPAVKSGRRNPVLKRRHYF